MTESSQRTEGHSLPVVIMTTDELRPREVAAFQKAQLQIRKELTLATLPKKEGQLKIEGIIPATVVLDSGANSILVGRCYARRIDKCRSPWLANSSTFITANGQENLSLGKTRSMLDLVLCAGSPGETTLSIHAVSANTDTYDVILGVDFFAECFGGLDFLTEEFIWRTDGSVADVPHTRAFLPMKCWGNNDDRRAHYAVKVISCASDIYDALLGEEANCGEFENHSQMENGHKDSIQNNLLIY